MHAAALAVERDRRGLPLRRARHGYTLADLKTAQDWILESQFRQVPGVIDVVGFGGTPRSTTSRSTRSAARPRPDAGAGARGDRQREPERRRTAPDAGRAVVQRARRRPDPSRSPTSATSWSRRRRALPIRVRDVADVSVGHAPRWASSARTWIRTWCRAPC
jgi:cobalt-zinc-cadmium resistance protein CzcA